MIEFSRPWMLLGLLAALLPLAVHLLGRRKVRVMRFSALAFLLQQNPARARAIRVRERALLGLRMAAVALLALALAKPLVPSLGEQSSMLPGDEPVAVVFVLDDSMSMGSQGGDGATRYQRSLGRLSELVSMLPLGSEAAVVMAGYPARPLQKRPLQDTASVVDSAVAERWLPRRDDSERAITMARRLLANSALIDRRVIVLSDLQRASYAALAPRPTDPGAKLAAAPSQSPAVQNLSITSARATAATDRGPRYVRVHVEVSNTGAAAVSGHVTVSAGDRELKRWLELKPGERARRSFVVPSDVGVAVATVPPDALAADNRRDIMLLGEDRLRIALVNGAPRPVPREDEVFFAAQALRLGSAGAEVQVDVVQLTDVRTTSWKQYDVIILANVAELPASAVAALDERVRLGAGLLVTMGDAAPDGAAAWTRTLLPWEMGVTRSLSAAASASRPTVAADDGNEVASDLRSSLGDIVAALQGGATRKQLLVAPSVAAGAATVVALGDGAPLLLAARRGKGHVALWTTSLDRDWTDIPLQPGYLPLLGALTQRLGEGASAAGSLVVRTGESSRLARDPRAGRLEIRAGTDDGPLARTVKASAQLSGHWQLEADLTPGRYRLLERSATATWRSRTMLVVAPASEMAVNALDDPSRWQGRAGPASQRPLVPRSPGWPLALLLLMVALIMEGVVAWRMGERSGQSLAKAPVRR